MRRTIVLLLGLLTTLLTADATAANAQTKSVELYDYVVKKGDTCIRIAKRELGSRKGYKLIHKHNPKMGPSPHRLKAGEILKLPRKNHDPDAHITDQQGRVRVRKPAVEDWFKAKNGMALFRSWRVNSREKSSAELTFADRSAIRLRENTVVIVYGPSVSRARKQQAYAALERGTLRARLGEFDPKRRVVVDTPGSQTELSSGSALVSVDDKGTSRVANHGGKKVVVRSRGRRSRSVDVAVGMGSKVKKNKPPEKPRPLPPTPVWEPGPRQSLGFALTGGAIRGKWAAVPEAKQYRVEIAIDPIARAVVASVVIPSSVTEFEASGLPTGKYFASVSAIDADKFESIPSPREVMTIGTIKVQGGATGTMGSPLKVVAGSTLSAGGGVQCQQGDGPPRQALVLVPGSPVRCFENGKELTAQPIEVVELRAQLAVSRTVGRASVEVIEIVLDAGDLEAPLLDARGRGLTVQASRRTAQGLALSVLVDDDAGETAAIELVSAGPDPTVVATLDVDIAARPTPEAPPAPPAPWQPRVGIDLFTAIADGERNVGDPAGLQPSLAVGARAGVRLRDRVVLELEGSYRKARVRETNDDATVLSARAGLRIDLITTKGAGLFLLGGPALLSVRRETTANEVGANYGLGMNLTVARRALLRLEARHVLLPSADDQGLASQLEVQLGAGWLF